MIFHYIDDFTKYVNSHPGLTIGITSGCFDLLHPLHIEYLNKCKRNCDKLFVLIDSDQLVEFNKNKIPLINEQDRAYMVDNLKSVHGTMVFNSLEDMETIFSNLETTNQAVKMFKHNDKVYGKEILKFYNIQNIIVPDIIRFQSTTEITNHLKQN